MIGADTDDGPAEVGILESGEAAPNYRANRPALDPELASGFDAVVNRLNVPLTPEKIVESRWRSEEDKLTDAEIACGGNFEHEVIVVPAADGSGEQIRVLHCRPSHLQSLAGAIFHIHGGGMVAGSYRSLELARDLARAKETGLAVLSADYRLAPEHPFPTPVRDCLALLDWTFANAFRLGFDPEQIVLSGTSAGGGLAASLALMVRDRGGLQPRGAMLQCPMLDERCNTVSARQMEAYGVWDTRSNRTGWSALLSNGRIEASDDGYAAAARASDLSGLPPIFIDVGSVESLRDESVEFAQRIWACGGLAELHVWAGAFHSFDQWMPDATISRAAERARISWLKRILTF